jgi:FMN phosphatase YigB (HAD superfamily)
MINKNIKTISFDLWNTLIQKNPDYSVARNNFIKIYTKLSLEQIKTNINLIKQDITNTMENFGVTIPNIVMYQMIINKCKIENLSATVLRSKCVELFFEYPPILKDGVYDILELLYNKKYQIFLSSNTLFIEGKWFDEYLKINKIYNFFEYRLYSDELCVAKPNPMFFKTLQEKSFSLKSEIMHVGDNFITDLKGGQDYGFSTILVQPTTNLYNLLTQTLDEE